MHNYFAENQAQAGHNRQSLRGGAVSLIARAINGLVQVGSVLFLARLLSPEDYGLVSMVTAVVGFAPLLIDLGTRDAVVQRPRISEGEVSALFWITVGVGFALASLVAASGPIIARFYHEPQLPMIALASSVTILASALTFQHQALMRRAMMFRKLAVLDVASNVLGAGGAITMAYYGFGYWALVMRPIITSVLLAFGTWIQCRWLPLKPSLTAGVKEMLRFGCNLIGFSFTDFVAKNMDRVAVGSRFGARGLGFYQNALLIYDNLLDLTFPLHGVAVVSLSKLLGNPEELRRVWAKALATLTFYAMPAFGILAVTSQDLISLVLTSKWQSAGVLLSVLALRGIPHVAERTLGWLHIAAGRSDRWLRWGIFATVLQAVALIAGLPFGPTGVATAYVLITFALFLPALTYAGQPLGIKAGDVARTVGPQMCGAVLAAGISFACRFLVFPETSPVTRIAALVCVYLAAYLLLVVGIFRVRNPLHVAMSLLADFVPARFAPFIPFGIVRGTKP